MCTNAAVPADSDMYFVFFIGYHLDSLPTKTHRSLQHPRDVDTHTLSTYNSAAVACKVIRVFDQAFPLFIKGGRGELSVLACSMNDQYPSQTMYPMMSARLF